MSNLLDSSHHGHYNSNRMEGQMKPGAAIVVGRFQVPRLHEGHHFVISKTLEYQRSIILIGCHPGGSTKTNPLDYASRYAMIKSAYPTALIAPLPDHPADLEWSRRLDTLIRVLHPHGDVVIFGGRDSFIPHYSGDFIVEEIEDRLNISGTKIRESEALYVRDHEDFRWGSIYSTYNRYPNCCFAVDIAAIKSTHDKDFLAVGRKPGEKEWRLPGGFVSSTDSCLEDTAKRELNEETGLVIEGDVSYLGSLRTNDWRYRHEDKLFTALFAGFVAHGDPVPSDDLSEAAWISLADIESTNWHAHHAKLAKIVKNWVYGKFTHA